MQPLPPQAGAGQGGAWQGAPSSLPRRPARSVPASTPGRQPQYLQSRRLDGASLQKIPEQPASTAPQEAGIREPVASSSSCSGLGQPQLCVWGWEEASQGPRACSCLRDAEPTAALDDG